MTIVSFNVRTKQLFDRSSYSCLSVWVCNSSSRNIGLLSHTLESNTHIMISWKNYIEHILCMLSVYAWDTPFKSKNVHTIISLFLILVSRQSFRNVVLMKEPWILTSLKFPKLLDEMIYIYLCYLLSWYWLCNLTTGSKFWPRYLKHTMKCWKELPYTYVKYNKVLR